MSRIYKIIDGNSFEAILVRANSKGSALRFIAEKRFSCAVATHDDIYESMKEEVPIENAVAPEQVDIDDTVEPPPAALASAFRALEEPKKTVAPPPPPPPPSSSAPAKPAAKVDEFQLPGKKIGEPAGFQAPPKQDEF